MVRIPLTPEIIAFVSKLLLDPVFSKVVSDYTIDKNFLYFPKSRIKNKTHLRDLKKSGFITVVKFVTENNISNQE